MEALNQPVIRVKRGLLLLVIFTTIFLTIVLNKARKLRYSPIVKSIANEIQLEYCQKAKTESLGNLQQQLHDGLRFISSVHFNVSSKLLRRLSLDDESISKILLGQEVTANKRKFPTIVTAASSNHFYESQAMLKNIHERVLPFFNTTIVYWDLGLARSERKQLERFCRCNVRRLPWIRLPKHIHDLTSYGWKPLCIQLTLIEEEMIMWMDTSPRFHRLDGPDGVARRLFQIVDTAYHSHVLGLQGGSSIAARIDNRTIEFFGDSVERLKNQGEIEANWMLFRRSQFTFKAILRPLVSCALNPTCMAPQNPVPELSCPDWEPWHVGTCHRFDQAVLGLLLTRLFPNCRDQHVFSHIGQLKRNQEENYFEMLEKTSFSV